MRRLNAEGRRFFANGDYSEAHASFLSAVSAANRIGDRRDSALNWNNAGSSSLHAMQYRTALSELTRARAIAEAAQEPRPLSFALNNLASLYLHIGERDQAIATARAALRDAAGSIDRGNRARLQCELASALLQNGRRTEALDYYRQGINGLIDAKDLEGASLAWGMLGDDSLQAGDLDDAERAYTERFRLVRLHNLNATPNVFSGLARVRSLRGDSRSAAALFETALDMPAGPTPRWGTYSDRGAFYLAAHRLPEAVADFRKARDLASRMRADMVPADFDRVNFENGLSHFLEGLIEAGNRLARQTGDSALLAETFDAAEQDRLWSLRALVPEANDWRTRLPERYWNLLARYRTAEQSHSPAAAKLEDELHQIEVDAAAESSAPGPGSALARARGILGPESVLFSFHVSKTSSWVWAVANDRIDAYPLPPLSELQGEAEALTSAVQSGAPSTEIAATLYRELFGAIPQHYLGRPNWRLEPDGPLYEVPFAGLVAGRNGERPVYLIERASIESVPGALLMSQGKIAPGGGFLGIGDPVYNSADPRYRGATTSSANSLPRLPNTAAELQSCARSWDAESQLLSGADATSSGFAAALATNPEIVHFATHVIAEPGDFRSGLIALSLKPSGTLDLLGPKEIVARRLPASVVVMNGCHSAQGQTLAGAGLMGLTRAWIGAGASAVIATQWDVPDEAAQSIMTDFYARLRTQPDRGLAAALREAELGSLKRGQAAATWSAYSLLSRIP
ncbi:MAG: CHAT domain-containing protein [Acidobacteriota bacterium]|nr:CHAT domain-containing protein [Acidobacteriota bacterium]